MDSEPTWSQMLAPQFPRALPGQWFHGSEPPFPLLRQTRLKVVRAHHRVNCEAALKAISFVGAQPSVCLLHVPRSASSFYYCCSVYFERQHLQHIHLDYTHLDYKTTKGIYIRNCLAQQLRNTNWKRRLLVGHVQVHAGAHASTSNTCSSWLQNAQRVTHRYELSRALSLRARSRSRPGIYTPTATLLAGCREVKIGNQRGRKAHGREAFQASRRAQRRLPVCWLMGKVSTRVFLLGWNFWKGLPAGNLPHKGRMGSRTAQIQRKALHTDTHTH